MRIIVYNIILNLPIMRYLKPLEQFIMANVVGAILFFLSVNLFILWPTVPTIETIVFKSRVLGEAISIFIFSFMFFITAYDNLWSFLSYQKKMKITNNDNDVQTLFCCVLSETCHESQVNYNMKLLKVLDSFELKDLDYIIVENLIKIYENYFEKAECKLQRGLMRIITLRKLRRIHHRDKLSLTTQFAIFDIVLQLKKENCE